MSWRESQTNTHIRDALECAQPPCRRPICLEYCGAVVGPSLWFPELKEAEPSRDTDTCAHTHSLLRLVSLLYLLSLSPIHLTFHYSRQTALCVSAQLQEQCQKSPTVTVIRFLWPPLYPGNSISREGERKRGKAG